MMAIKDDYIDFFLKLSKTIQFGKLSKIIMDIGEIAIMKILYIFNKFRCRCISRMNAKVCQM